MSWIYSQALMDAYANSPYSLGLVAEFSADTCSDGGQSAPSKSNPIPQAYCSPDRMTEFSRLSRYGMTFAPLTADRGEALLTSYLAAFRAKTSASPEKAQESPESAADSGQKWRGSLARFDRDSSSWKTAQLSLLGDSEQSSVIWPRSGMTAGGQCWELPTFGRRTRGTDCGLWQTPVADDAACRKLGKYNSRGEPKLSAQVKLMWPTPTASMITIADMNQARYSGNKGGNRPSYAEAKTMWPTPTSTLGTHGGMVTPTKGREGGTLIEALSARAFATPTSRDWESGKASQETMDRNSRPLSEQIGGSLNPTWVEWLMGWPLEWSDLRPLETGKYRQWLRQHGGC